MTTRSATDLDMVRRIADAVLYEGYLLYPYRSDSAKNQVRWQFGMVGPVGAAADGAGEDSRFDVACILHRTDHNAAVDLRLRFLQPQWRGVEELREDGSFEPVARLTVGGDDLIAWHEATSHELDWPGLSLNELILGWSAPITLEGTTQIEDRADADGSPKGRLVRQSWPIRATIEATATAVEPDLFVITVALHNTSVWHREVGDVSPRDTAARSSFVGTHFVLSGQGCEWVSTMDTPDWAAASSALVRNARCWPVLVGGSPQGDAGGQTSDVVLCAPIILYDNPEIADESPGDLFDALEIDEILTLRVMTLTDEEKRAARATDARAAAIIDRCDDMPPEIFERLHGAVKGYGISPDPVQLAEPDFPTFVTPSDRVMPSGQLLVPDEGMPWWDPATDPTITPSTDTVVVNGVTVGAGSTVILRPHRRADAHDMFLAGMQATVRAVHTDVDDQRHIAVTLDDDPGSDLHEWYGRYYYFADDEVEPQS